MSTRAERKERARRRCCRGCGEYQASHFDPWTKTYVCQPPPEESLSEADADSLRWIERAIAEAPPLADWQKSRLTRLLNERSDD